MSSFSFMPGAGDKTENIVSILKMLNENIKRGYTPALPKSIKTQVERIISLDPKKDRERIKEIYDDLLDEFIAQDIEFPI